MDNENSGAKKVSLRSAGETESTVLEEQRLGGVSKVSAKLQKPTTDVDDNANRKAVLQTEIPTAGQQDKSQVEGDVTEGDDETIEEEEVVEEVEEEENEEGEEEDECEEESGGEEEEAEEESGVEQVENESEGEDREDPAPIVASLVEAPATTSEEPSINIHARETESNVEPPLTTLSVSIGADTTALTHVNADKGDHSEKPVIPPQTYLWKEVEKSKEQGGYPWTHLYKNPLGPDDEPEVILRYTHSPVNRRRKVEEQLIDGNSREEKKAKTENGYEAAESTETESPSQEAPIIPEIVMSEIRNGETNTPRRSRTRAASHEPHSLRDEFKTHAKHFLDEHPRIRTFSNSLTRQGKRTRAFVSRSLERAKSMADKQIDKAKDQMNTLRRRKAASEPPRDLPDHKILMLCESPRFGNREIPAYVVRQPSDDEVMDMSEADTSEKVLQETSTVVPDEIIEIPQQPVSQPIKDEVQVEKMEVEEERYEVIEPPKDELEKPKTPDNVVQTVPEEVKPQPPPKAPRKKKEHHYEDIEDYVPKKDVEQEDSKLPTEAKLKRQHEIDGFDPIVGEMFSNDKIKISLQLQDEKIADDMLNRKKRLEEILQNSSEDEKDKIPSLGLLAPISSIDSTSSDEDARRMRLSALTEESDTGSVDIAVLKKQDSAREADLPVVTEGQKELELTPAEEKKILEDSSNQQASSEEEKIVEKQLELTPAEERMLFEAEAKSQITPVEEKVLNTEPIVEKELSSEDSKPATDERWSKMSDHEYEPIGEPVEDKHAEAVKGGLALPTDDKKRKLSTSSLRVPLDEGDTISMEELQKDIEDRYFNRPSVEQATMELSEPVEVVAQEKTSKVKSAMARAHESSKKAMAKAQVSSRNAMVKAQEGGKSLHQKLRKQTDKFKTKITNINIKKDKDVAPLASPEIVTTPEIEKLDFTIAEPKPEQETEDVESVPVQTDEATEVETEEVVAETGTTKKRFRGTDFSKIKNIQMPKLHKPEFKRPEFTKISKPKMPKLKTPDMSKFKRPEMPKFLTEKPDFSKLKMPEKIGTIKIQRSKSMKEPVLSSATSAASPSDVETASAIGGDGTKKELKYNDFSTFPRLLDKFKRQKPSDESVRASTPPPLEFTKAGKTSRAKGTGFVSRWAEKSSEDAGSTRFFTGSEMGEHEGSVEKRIRQRLERAEFEEPELAVTAEQKQLEEYDKENREIHLLSAARHDEFMKRKPPMERQESDLASEEEKQFWASSLGQKIRQNIDMNSNDFDFLDEEDRLRSAREIETMALSAQDRARFLGEPLGEHSEKDYDMRSTTPYSNKECQSSGSSGIRRRKGVIEEIDDDEFFLRQKGISKDNIQMGEYISTAIKEGLSTPKNALAEMGRYDPYFDDEAEGSERMSMDYRAEPSARGRYYQPSFESDDVSNKQSFTEETNKQADFFKTFPPDRPMRKHKKSYNEDQFHDDQQKVPYDSYQQEEEQEVEFYGRDRKYDLEPQESHTEREERFIDEESVGNGFTLTGSAVPPTPPRRRKKRFREFTPSELTPFGEGLTSKPIYNSYTLGPETHIFNAGIPLAQEESFTTPLPTPRRSRSRSQISKIDDDRTSRGAESYIFGAEDNALARLAIDMSESNGYATVRKEPPPRPPAPIRRRKSTRSLEDHRPYNTLPNFHSISPARPSRNYSTINPSRPPRGRSISSLNESATKLSTISKEDITQYEDIEAVEDQVKLHEALQSGAVVKKMKDRPLPPPPRPPRDNKKPKRFDQDDRFDFDGGTERIFTMDTIEPRVIEEVEIAIQTDPVSDEFELDIEVSETMTKPERTLRDILKEEQQAEIDRARQLAEASNLMRDIQKFRDSTSSLSLHGSRPETPSAMSFERRVSAPSTSQIVQGLSSENLTEQDLANIDDDKFIAELVKKYVSEEKVTDNAKKPQKVTEEPRIVTDRVEKENEPIIVQEDIQIEEIRAVQSGPAAPPRRRSLVSSTHDIPTSIEIPQNVIEEIVERLRTNEQQHIAELEQIHKQQLEELRKQQEEQRKLQEEKLAEQQKVLLDQQNQQLHETQQLKEQILQQQEQQMALLQQQQQQQQQLLLAQQQQKLLLQQQEKERELQRERERELLREREIELEKSRERERELHHARELELQRARELEQQRAKELEHQRLRELELQRTMELEHQRLRELELQRVQEAEVQRARDAEIQRAREAELQRAREAEIQRIRETELLRAQEAELLKLKEIERKVKESQVRATKEEASIAADENIGQVELVEPALEINEIDKEIAVSTANKPADKPAVESTPTRPPLPRISSQIPMNAQFSYQEYLPYSLPPQPLYPTRNLSDEEGGFPQAPHRRRRHHRSRRESTSEEEFQREQRKQRHGTRSPEPSIPALGGQLIRACGTSIRETGDELMTILRASSKDENKRDLHIALIILIVIVAGLMALGMSGDQSVHHHHWDYFTPPGNSGR